MIDKLADDLTIILMTHDLTCKGAECQISVIDLARLALKEHEAAKAQQSCLVWGLSKALALLNAQGV